jgi:hypothetical protein
MTTAPAQKERITNGQRMKELILLLLINQPDYELKNKDGFVSADIRKLGELPDSGPVRTAISSALADLAAENRIVRKITSNRTYAVKLNESSFTNEEFEGFVARADDIRSIAQGIFSGPSEKSLPFAQLVEDCQRGFEAMCITFRNKSKSGRPTRLNCIEVLIRSGLSRPRARVVRYYLKELGLATTTNKVAGTREWYWAVKVDGEVKEDALVKVVQREGSIHNPTKSKFGPYKWEDTRHERQFAGSTPAVLPKEKCGPVVKTTASISEKTTLDPKTVPSEVSESIVFRQLLNLVQTLEEKSAAAEATIRELREEIRRLEAKPAIPDADLKEALSLLERHDQ